MYLDEYIFVYDIVLKVHVQKTNKHMHNLTIADNTVNEANCTRLLNDAVKRYDTIIRFYMPLCEKLVALNLHFSHCYLAATYIDPHF